jgi:hypothetical protein
MKKNHSILVMAILISFVFIGPILGNSEELVCKKTIALSSGETVCDLSGEWNYEFVSRGDTRTQTGPGFVDVIRVTQQGNSFQGIRMLGGSSYTPKGQVALEGELDKNGIIKLMHRATPFTTGSVTNAKISKDGNKIELESNSFLVELSRK